MQIQTTVRYQFTPKDWQKWGSQTPTSNGRLIRGRHGCSLPVESESVQSLCKTPESPNPQARRAATFRGVTPGGSPQGSHRWGNYAPVSRRYTDVQAAEEIQWNGDFPGGPVAKNLLPVQGSPVWSLVRELILQALTKDPFSHNQDQRSRMCHVPPGTGKMNEIFKKEWNVHRQNATQQQKEPATTWNANTVPSGRAGRRKVTQRVPCTQPRHRHDPARQGQVLRLKPLGPGGSGIREFFNMEVINTVYSTLHNNWSCLWMGNPLADFVWIVTRTRIKTVNSLPLVWVWFCYQMNFWSSRPR